MFRSKAALLLAGVVTLGCMTGSSSAQSGPFVGAGQFNNSVQTLSDFNLPQMLKNLGYNVQERTNNNGRRWWVVTAKQGTWTYVVEVVPYRNINGQIAGFWLKSPLGNPVNTNGLSSAGVLKLMQVSHQMAPFFFSYNPVNRRIYMNYEYPGNRISQSNLQRQFNSLFSKIHQTATWWNGNNLHTNVAGNSGFDS